MYSLSDYGRMLADRRRREAYLRALEAAIEPGSLVLEIGTGPGVFALLAARLGARKVWAVEPDETIHLARRLVEANGLGDRVELLQTTSEKLELPEKVDVIFSDLRGTLPLLGRHLASVVDARERLLTPGGALIPAEDTLWATPIEAEDLWEKRFSPWRGEELGLELGPAAETASHVWTRADLRRARPLGEARRWATLDYRELQGPDCRGRVAWNLAAAGTAHGVGAWFDTRLHAGVGFSNAPGAPRLVYGQAFFPFPRPVHLEAGDLLAIHFEAKLVGGEYVWGWTTRVERGRETVERFRQSTFLATPLALETVHRRSASFAPELGDEGRILGFVLERMDGARDLAAIAEELLAAEPEHFADLREALDRVADVSLAFARSTREGG